MKKKFLNLCIMLSMVGGIIFSSCSKDDDSKEEESKGVIEREFRLSGEDPYKYGSFYDIELDKNYFNEDFFNGDTIYFDFAFYVEFYGEVEGYKIISPSYVEVKYHIDYEIPREVIFYELPSDFNNNALDTIKTSLQLRNLVANCNKVNSGSKSDYIYFDKTNYSNKIYGFKLLNGKYGILRIKSLDDDGNVELYIKFEE